MDTTKLLNEANNLYEQELFNDAARIYSVLAENGNYTCARRLGWMYFDGLGVEFDLSLSRKWFEAAANANDLNAQFGLGKVCLRENKIDEAIELFKKASASGFTPATCRLGIVYMAIDEIKAQKYLEKARDLGHLGAQRELAVSKIRSRSLFIKLGGIWDFVVVGARAAIILNKNLSDERTLY